MTHISTQARKTKFLAVKKSFGHIYQKNNATCDQVDEIFINQNTILKRFHTSLFFKNFKTKEFAFLFFIYLFSQHFFSTNFFRKNKKTKKQQQEIYHMQTNQAPVQKKENF